MLLIVRACLDLRKHIFIVLSILYTDIHDESLPLHDFGQSYSIHVHFDDEVLVFHTSAFSFVLVSLPLRLADPSEKENWLYPNGVRPWVSNGRIATHRHHVSSRSGSARPSAQEHCSYVSVPLKINISSVDYRDSSSFLVISRVCL